MLSSLVSSIIGTNLLSPAIDTTTLLQRYLTRLLALVALTTFSAFMCCLVIVGLLYGLYEALVRHGLQADVALMVVLGLVTLTAIGAIATTVHLLSGLREVSATNVNQRGIQRSRASSVFHAFLDGLKGHAPGS